MVTSTVRYDDPWMWPVWSHARRVTWRVVRKSFLIAFTVLVGAAKDGKMNFFDEVSKQLVEGTSDTQRKMKESEKTAPVLSQGQVTAVQVAKGWTRTILNPEVLPTDAAPYVAFPAEAGQLDVIRAWYTTKYGEIRIAQTFCVFSITIKPVSLDLRSPEAEANAMAKLILRQNARIHLEPSGTEDHISYGTQKVTKEASAHWDWVDLLRWWTGGEVIGFLTLKASAEPGMAILSWDIEFNRDWFRLYERAK